jgi:ribosomal protein S18 acetylase RimI-like enzyme
VAGFIDGLSTSGALGLFLVVLVLAAWRAGWKLPSLRVSPIIPAAAAAIVVALNGLNWLPLAKAWYSTTGRYSLFWLNQIYGVLFGAVFSGIEIFLLWYLAHWMGQQVWPRQDRILPRRGDRWHRLARSGWRGLMVGMVMGGYVVAFYLLATQVFGGWTPMGPDYSNTYATPLPFLGSLRSGLLPALSEELQYRLLGIAAVLWLLRTFTRLPDRLNRLLALLVPGVLWAFAHLTYVRDPFYLRGIELTVVATLLGWAFLRFDLTTTIVAHFVFNAGLGALPLLRSGEPYFVVSGLIVVAAMLVPLMPYAVRALRRRLRGATGEEVYPHIRPANPADQAQLVALDLDVDAWAPRLADPAAEVLCLTAGGEVVGVAAGRMMAEDEGAVLEIYVNPQWRRRYWGSELLHRLQAQLRHRGATSIRAGVDVNDRVGMSFMTSQGWRRRRVIFSWPPQPPTLPSLRDLWHRLRDLWRWDRSPADRR